MARPGLESLPAAVILGGVLNARSAARTLRRYGVDVHFLPDLAYGTGVRQLGKPGGPKHWLECLTECSAAIRGAVVVPCSDHALEFLAEHRGWLSGAGYRPVPANDDAVMDMLDKGRTFELAQKADVAVPNTSVITSLEGLREAAARFSFPCALKPVYSHRFQRQFSVKAFVADSPSELERFYLAIMDTGVEMLATEVVRGVDDEYCSFYTYVEDDGTPLVTFTKRKLRQYPIGFGLGTFHMSKWEPEAAALGLRFARTAELRGLVNVEFKRDAKDGQLKLIECNARLTAANELVRRAGVDFARISYDRALGRSKPISAEFREGFYEWHPMGDFRAFRDYRSNGELTAGQWLRSLWHPRLGLPVVDRSDMLALVARAANRVRKSA